MKMDLTWKQRTPMVTQFAFIDTFILDSVDCFCAIYLCLAKKRNWTKGGTRKKRRIT
jgi:hypothetical protein